MYVVMLQCIVRQEFIICSGDLIVSVNRFDNKNRGKTCPRLTACFHSSLLIE